MNAQAVGYGGGAAQASNNGLRGFHARSYVAEIATSSSSFVAKRETGGVAFPRYTLGMLHEWLSDALEETKIGQAELSRRLTEKLGRSIDRAAVNKMVSDKRKISADELRAIEEITGKPAPTALGIVGVYGIVSAGGQIETESEQLTHGHPLFEIEVDFPVPSDAFALEIRGQSMWPRYDDGDVVICYRQSQDPALLLGWEAVVATPEGNRYLKRLMKSDDGDNRLFTLESHNALPMKNVIVAWASEVRHVVRASRWRKLDDKAKRREIRKAVA